MPKVSVNERQIETRAKNKTTHPGKVCKTTKRRTKEEVQQEKDAKAQAKADLAEARQQSINRTAEFERADIANEDMVDATPRPNFTPKSRPISRSKNSPLTSFPNTSDIESYDGHDHETLFRPASEGSDDADAENDTPKPAKKKRAKITQSLTGSKVDAKKPGKTADRKRRVDDVEDDVPLNIDEEQPQEPKPKKTKMKIREEIQAATTILENEKEGNKYAKMVKLIGLSGKPASTVPSSTPPFQPEPVDGSRKLRREGAIADIKSVGENLNGAIADINKSTALNIFPVSSRSGNNTR